MSFIALRKENAYTNNWFGKMEERGRWWKQENYNVTRSSDYCSVQKKGLVFLMNFYCLLHSNQSYFFFPCRWKIICLWKQKWSLLFWNYYLISDFHLFFSLDTALIVPFALWVHELTFLLEGCIFMGDMILKKGTCLSSFWTSSWCFSSTQQDSSREETGLGD